MDRRLAVRCVGASIGVEISPARRSRYQRTALVGGDLNTWTGWSANESFLARDLNLLQRFEALGLVDCLAQMRPKGRLEGCTCTFGDAYYAHLVRGGIPAGPTFRIRTTTCGHPRLWLGASSPAKLSLTTIGSRSPITRRSSRSLT